MGGVLLDVGCGAQPYRPLLPVDVQYRGIDTADAQAHFGYRMPDTVYFDGDAWPVESGSVDVVLSTETLEHVLEPSRFLAEARRCLRPGGTILMTVPFSARWHFIPHDYWRYTPSTLQHLLDEAGFNEIGVYPRGNAVTVAAYKVLALGLPFLVPQHGGALRRAASLGLGVLALPLLLVPAVIGRMSLASGGGDDCLGYTVKAVLGGG
jgi:SAM-dependent methyltransferase